MFNACERRSPPLALSLSRRGLMRSERLAWLRLLGSSEGKRTGPQLLAFFSGPASLKVMEGMGACLCVLAAAGLCQRS